MRPRTIGTLLLLLVVNLSGITISAFSQEPPSSERKVITRVVPRYPDLARKMNLRGTVKVEAVIAPNGTLQSTHVIGGNPLLTQAAVDAIGKWKWAPAPQESKELILLNFHPE